MQTVHWSEVCKAGRNKTTVRIETSHGCLEALEGCMDTAARPDWIALQSECKDRVRMAKAGAENETERRNSVSKGSLDTNALLTAHRRGDICAISAMESMCNPRGRAGAMRTDSTVEGASESSPGPK